MPKRVDAFLVVGFARAAIEALRPGEPKASTGQPIQMLVMQRAGTAVVLNERLAVQVSPFREVRQGVSAAPGRQERSRHRRADGQELLDGMAAATGKGALCLPRPGKRRRERDGFWRRENSAKA